MSFIVLNLAKTIRTIAALLLMSMLILVVYIETMVTSSCQTVGHNLMQPPTIHPCPSRRWTAHCDSLLRRCFFFSSS